MGPRTRGSIAMVGCQMKAQVHPDRGRASTVHIPQSFKTISKILLLRL